MSDKRAWRDYLAADEEYERADRRLRATDYEPALVRALASGTEMFAALGFLSVHRPLETVHRLLPVLLPLAIEGGSEQGEVRAVVLAADRSAVTEALPALVDHVVSGPAEGDEAYLAYYGLMDLLETLEERQLLRRVIRAARRSPDPEVHSAADDFDDDFGALKADVEDEDVHIGAQAVPGPPDPQAAQAWQAYDRAWSRRNVTRNELLRRRGGGLGAGLGEHLRSGSPAAARLAADMLGSQEYAKDIREAFGSLETAALREAVSLVADALLADHRLRQVRFRALLTLLTEVPDTAGFAMALERARASTDPQIRSLAP
ncbi:MAG TPA: hypothetical protein VF062_13805 [Candidatus Limnocylindrales bacterium]